MLVPYLYWFICHFYLIWVRLEDLPKYGWLGILPGSYQGFDGCVSRGALPRPPWRALVRFDFGVGLGRTQTVSHGCSSHMFIPEQYFFIQMCPISGGPSQCNAQVVVAETIFNHKILLLISLPGILPPRVAHLMGNS